MKIQLNKEGVSLSTHYIETLVLLYLPLEKFGISEKDSLLDFSVSDNDGIFYGSAELTFDGISTKKTLSIPVSEFPDETDKAKCFAGRLFLDLFSERFGYTPPWGIMTGVRPAHLAFELMRKGCSPEKSRNIIERYYLADHDKAKLAVTLALIDKELCEGMNGNEYSLYIGIPFCPTRCRYCSFVSYATDGLKSLLPEYMEKLSSEISSVTDVAKEVSLKLKSVYVGGGTPSILDEGALEHFLEHINRCTENESFEFDFEGGRPDTLTRKKLEILKKHGVKRLCINTQTTNDEILRLVGRNHTFEDYKRAFYDACELGFVINTDLIAGLPGESYESFCRSLDDVCTLNPQNITVHSFSLKKSSDYTVGGQRLDVTDKGISDMLSYCEKKMSMTGYHPYYMYRQKNTSGNLHNVGYTDSMEHMGLYNVYMMEGLHSVLACGAGASTKLVSGDMKTTEKIYNHKYPYEYLKADDDILKKKEVIKRFFENR